MPKILILVLALATGMPALANPAEPVELIRQTTEELFTLIDQNRSEFEQDPERLQEALRERLLPHLDTVYSARLVLGRHGRGLEQEKIEAFAEALSNVLMRNYATGLLDFESRDQVEILPLAGDNTERATRVRTRLELDSGEQAPVDYVLRRSDDQWRVFDVIIEGISYVATFRNQIGEEIRRDGFDSMLARLQAGDIELDVDVES
ncbi:MlaC/ttg2D family ABC transporter substrate-binding protein [Wenzhouxiangella limi]|uniref:ABC transporter substrate-binding protein n=1 Tax=Wenzhouxiangella limi TaxID=2707351 RepID=A0A845UW17_9GAMM|nr:ABC transporter substrate-binding protein [Wenzhouxiangella limi]NDY94442.1 ABC transporter substrate-binding protein [Wenzhouxiangella limi]